MDEIKARRALLLMEQATQVLREALDEDGGLVDPQPETSVIWGRDGLTGAGDPRATTARSHASVDGKITCVWTQVHVLPDKPYRCTHVSVIGEASAGGQHVAIVAQRGGSEQVALFTGYGGDLDFDSIMVHAPGREIIIDGGFTPPNLGPLAIALVDENGYLLSDVVASLGLPDNHHVNFVIEFTKR